ncbi:MAG: dihydrofolate reductase [Candidatus Heimdallarchaeota archaeon]|nr:MAG: dihydrofolate reductase [Candidatus Heimdallarchaeota archaeon]
MKILVTAPFHESGLKELQKHCEVIYESWRETGIIYFDEDELINKLNDYEVDIFITEADEVDASVIDKTNLKLIASTRGTPVNIDEDAANKKDIPVIHTPHRNADAVADLTVAMMLTQARKMIEIDRFLRSGKYNTGELESDEDFAEFHNRFRGVELNGLTIGIIGFGAIGSRVAQRLYKGFGSNILYFDPYVLEDHEIVLETAAKRVSLETLMTESDMITIHTPSVEETEELVNAEMFALMKPTAHFFNLARSYCINEDALYDAIKEKRIAGAGLDSFDDEPVDSENRFLEFDNVTVMPHFGGNTVDVVRHQTNMITQDILNFLQSKPLKNIWNPQT